MAINALVEADNAEEEKETNPLSTAIVLVVLIVIAGGIVFLKVRKKK